MSPGADATRIRRALQPLWNALDAVEGVVAGGAVVAVSGGGDSRSLLEAWARWPRRHDAVVVTIDHAQHAESAAAAERVVTIARDLGLPAVSVRITPAGRDEASLRAARYAALDTVAAAHGFPAVVVAHHQDDVAEGLLLHLLGWGGGRDGGAPPVARSLVSPPAAGGEAVDIPRQLVRPFLRLPRAVLRAPLPLLGGPAVEVDPADSAGENARGRLRREVLPTLSAVQPGVADRLALHARRLAEDDDCLQQLVPPTPRVPAHLHPALLRRWLKRMIADVGVVDPRTSPAALETVLRLAGASGEGRVAVRGATVVVGRPEGSDVRQVWLEGPGQAQRPRGRR